MFNEILPYELVVEILLRLPVKSLLCCTSVCKSWNSFITSPKFIDTHLHHSLNRYDKRPSCLVRQVIPRDGRTTLKETLSIYDLYAWDKLDEIELPYVSNAYRSFVRRLDSINGVLCFSDDAAKICLLYNPFIRKAMTFPYPRSVFTPDERYDLGFGFDSEANDYKLISILFLNQKSPIPPMVQICSSSQGVWRAIHATPPRCNLLKASTSAFLNGSIHWIANNAIRQKESVVYSNFLLKFDVVNETFDVMKLPETFSETSLTMDSLLQVMKFGEYLSIIYRDPYAPSTYSMWVMKDCGVADSWMMFRNFETNGTGKLLDDPTMSISEDLMLLSKCRRIYGDKWTQTSELLTYEIETGLITDLGISSAGDSLCVVPYIESLFLVRGVTSA